MSAIIYSFIIAPSMQCELNKIKQCTSLACTLTFVFDIKLNLCKLSSSWDDLKDNQRPCLQNYPLKKIEK